MLQIVTTFRYLMESYNQVKRKTGRTSDTGSFQPGTRYSNLIRLIRLAAPSLFLPKNGASVPAGARSNLRQLSRGRQLDFGNQEFVFPLGLGDAGRNLRRKKVRRSRGIRRTNDTGKLT